MDNERTQSTLDLYESNYNRIIENIGYDFTLDELLKHLEGLAANTQLSYIQSIVITRELRSGDIFDYFIELKKEIDTRTQGLTDKEKEIDFSWEKFKTTYNNMETGTLHHLIASLYYYLPPLRQSEYIKMKFVESRGKYGMNFKKMNEFNYYDSDKQTFTITNSKTQRHFKKRVLDIPDKLNKIILSYNPTDVKSYDDKDYIFRRKLTTSNFTKILNKIFGDGVSVDILRKTYISSVVPTMNIYERKKLATMMGHSLSSQMLTYDKNITNKTVLQYN